MYVVTFYSYKGGVGRTMALVNTAVMLARMGRRVLVVDFDLEAPGLPSYQVFRDLDCARGVVDYVTSYRATGIAPNAAEFIYKSDIEGSPIWLMPAGAHTQPGYSDALQSIDWQELYEHQSGYLMFEDLKQQWAQYGGSEGFHYVLVDSRTGHTDVGGICTRQLPDAVVVMFVPNEQNIGGLSSIVEDIRAERRPKGKKRKIDLHFCPSNVPDLDDEKNILRDLLKRARDIFDYDETASIIHHYASLEVLTQSAFAISRPTTRLSKEYEKLRTSVMARNFNDSAGALVALQRMPNALRKARLDRKNERRASLLKDVLEIRSIHPKDGQIAHLAGNMLRDLGELSEAAEAYTAAIEAGTDVSAARLSRAYLFIASGKREEAAPDLLETLSSQTATLFELAPILTLAQTIGSIWLEAVEKALDRPDSEITTIMALTQIAIMSRDALPIVANRMERLLLSEVLNETDLRRVRNTAVLARIGMREFNRAITLIDSEGLSAHEDNPFNLAEAFNLAIATWGETKQIPHVMFEKLAARLAAPNSGSGVNFHQCVAVVYGVLGDLEMAGAAIEAAKESLSSSAIEFSCWQYLNVTSEDMEADLKAMEGHILAGAIADLPFFKDPATVH